MSKEIKDVASDGNCLFWSIMLPYLEQVKKDEQKFKERYHKLFGTKENWSKIFNFSNFDFVENKNLVLLFRNQVVDYIKKNLDTKRPENKAEFRSMLLDSDINKKKLIIITKSS